MQPQAEGLHAFDIGRLTINLPANARISGSEYLFREREQTDLESISLTIVQQPADAGSVRTLWQTRQTELSAPARSSLRGGNMLAEAKEIAPNTYLLRHYTNAAVTSSYYTTVIALVGTSAITLETKSFDNKYEEAESRLQKILANLALRQTGSKNSGFCVGPLILNDPPPEIESADVNFSIPSNPDITLELNTYSAQTPHEELLQVRGREGMSLLSRLGVSGAIRTLHSGTRAVGAFEGYELLLHSKNPDQMGYKFEWQYPGGPNRHMQPSIDVLMQTGQQVHTPAGRPQSLDDSQARELWDAIVGSIRLRPGAL